MSPTGILAGSDKRIQVSDPDKQKLSLYLTSGVSIKIFFNVEQLCFAIDM